jgi:GT2 family glycosyltransferase
MQNRLSGPARPLVACILVNWNNWQDTADCLAALAAQDYPALRVFVVDNGSSNDSLAQLRAAHSWATYIDNGYNAGFPKACNIGARHPEAAGAELVWMLNNDTVPPPDTLSRLVALAATNQNAGVIGAVLYYAHDPSRVQAWGGGSISRWTAYNRHFHAPVTLGADSYITFASALIRRETFNHLGGLFEGAFMYFEDSDFCLRARNAGWQLAVTPGTAILHKEGGSVKARPPLLDRIITVSGLIFLGRHAPLPFVARGLFLAARVGKRLVRRDWPGLRAVLLGFDDWRKGRVTPFTQ